MALIYNCRDLLKDKSDEFLLNPDIEPETAFNVYYPYDALEIEPGEILKIKWFSKESIEFVDIFLYRKSTQMYTISMRNLNNNEYTWHIPNDLHWSLHYSIKVQNHYNKEEFGFSDTFSIIER